MIAVASAAAVGAFLLVAPLGRAESHTLIAPASLWRYWDGPALSGTAWRGTSFNDGAWKQGTAELGYGDGDEATVIGFGPNRKNKYVTSYFRRSFTVPTSMSALELRLRRDDGAIVYLNGTEVLRSNLPAGIVTATTLATYAKDDGETWLTANVAGALLDTTNVIAVEVHQNALDTSDHTFDLQAVGTPAPSPSPSPSASGSQAPSTSPPPSPSPTLSDTPSPTPSEDSTPSGSPTPSASGSTPPTPTQPPPFDPLLVASGSTWRYWDGAGEPAGWRAPLFDDGTWKQGPAQLGYGDGDEATVIGFGPNGKNKYVTSYFRRHFMLPEGATGLQLQLRRDDGAIVYLNGNEVLRSNLAAGAVSSTTLASYASDDGATWQSRTIPLVGVVPGLNTIAVEIHQNAVNTSDHSFDAQLMVTLPGFTSTPTSTPSPSPSATTPSPSASATPTPTGTGTTRAYVAGDIGRCSGGNPTATANLLASLPDGPLVAPGDIAYPDGTAADFANCYEPTHGQFKGRTLPVPGNHEYNSGGGGYFAYFGSGVGTLARPWYATDIGAWRFMMLNSNCTASSVGGCGVGSRQYQWLSAQLASRPAPCLAAVWHHPRFTSGASGINANVRPLWQLLEQHGADLVLSGHEHNYERFARQNADGSASDSGIRQFVVGTGGASLYAFGSTILPNSQVRTSAKYGYLALDLGAEAYSWQFLPVGGGAALDAGSDTC